MQTRWYKNERGEINEGERGFVIYKRDKGGIFEGAEANCLNRMRSITRKFAATILRSNGNTADHASRAKV